MKTYRWKCPKCDRGKNLGPRPRKNATDRYCIPCSSETGILVKRTCPVLATKAHKGKERSKKKQATKAAKEHSKHMIGDYDIRKDYRRIWKIAHKVEPTLSKTAPKLEIRKRPEEILEVGDEKLTVSDATSGHAWYDRYLITITASANWGDVQYVLIHEVSHFIARRRGEPKHHGDIFKAAEAEMLYEAQTKEMPR